MNIKEKIQFVCVFLPIINSVAWLLYELGMDMIYPFIDVISVVGMISALVCIVLTDLIGFLKLAVSLVLMGWKLGMTIVPFFPICFVAAFVGFVIAFYILFLVCAFAPAILTIYFYFFMKDGCNKIIVRYRRISCS